MKTFSPEPMSPGAPIAWSHFTGHERIERTGIVWDRAPSVDGAVMVCWVVPDQPLPSDLYAAIAVGKSTRRQSAHGGYSYDDRARVAKRELFSSDQITPPLAVLAVTAARCAQLQRGECAQLQREAVSA